jgi:hypothetical protein
MGRFCIHKLLPFWVFILTGAYQKRPVQSILSLQAKQLPASFQQKTDRSQVNGLRLNRFDLRERFPQAGSQSRAAQSNAAVPQECGRIHADSTLYWVAGGNIIARLKRFSFLSFLVSLS